MVSNVGCFDFSGIISEVVPFNVPIKKRNRVGGVKTPPYERCVVVFIERKICPPNYNFPGRETKGISISFYSEK